MFGDVGKKSHRWNAIKSLSSCSSEDQNVGTNVDSKSQAQEILTGNKYSIGIWTRGHARYNLAENLSVLPMF